jgi:hypothetical protein
MSFRLLKPVPIGIGPTWYVRPKLSRAEGFSFLQGLLPGTFKFEREKPFKLDGGEDDDKDKEPDVPLRRSAYAASPLTQALFYSAFIN